MKKILNSLIVFLIIVIGMSLISKFMFFIEHKLTKERCEMPTPYEEIGNKELFIVSIFIAILFTIIYFIGLWLKKYLKTFLNKVIGFIIVIMWVLIILRIYIKWKYCNTVSLFEWIDIYVL